MEGNTAPSPTPGARVVRAELLDSLPHDDPEAIRSRRDLRRINALMGNDRWILRTAARFPDAATRGIVELGAGDGALAAKLARRFPDTVVSACDLAPRPPRLDHRVRWNQCDVFRHEAPTGGVLVANLFLHHFEGAALETLGRFCGECDALVFCEPHRGMLPHLLGGLIRPFVGPVTRHDMHVSIRAGFTRGELPRLLGLGAERWKIEETSTWRGSRRVLAYRA